MRHNEYRSSRSTPREPADTDLLDDRHSRRIEAFCEHYRPPILDLMRQSPAIGDLADSFPALLFALATKYGSETRRRSALAAVVEGMPLREAAGRIGLPMWLRKLPPAALQAPLTEPPADPALAARLVSLIPPQPAAAAAWLERVSIAHHTRRPGLALWVAQQYRAALPAPHAETFLTVLAWAWFSGATTDCRAAALLTTRWSPTIGVPRAAKEAQLWRERLALDVCLGPGLTDCWLAEGTSAGYDFVALRTADDFIAEALAMDNCLDRYTDRLEGRTARIFSIRAEGRSVADIEIAVHDREPGHPAIAQLRGPRNRRAPLDVWQAAYAWLGAQPPCASPKPGTWSS